jgi:hypothetical protein
MLAQRTSLVVVVALIMLGLPTAAAETSTIVTFSDPAPDANTPLFALVGNQFLGGWSGPNLTLLTPGLTLTGDLMDAKFSMTPVVATPVVPGYFALSGGTIDFVDVSNSVVFQITFGSATLQTVSGFAANDLQLNNVVFRDPAQFEWAFGEDSFAFSFANPTEIPGGYSWTASFTSSAIPEPPPPVLPGDLNWDGSVDFRDINPFVVYLSNFAVWQTAYPFCPVQNGDIDRDGTYPSFTDINPFVALLSGG